MLVAYNAEAVARGIVQLLGDADARAAAVRLSAGTDWSKIFDDVFASQARRDTYAFE